ncbi:MAG: Bug family tripartite tricarboxylate transporter substrate binding protein [Thermodesulfobacteriota bacterium]
MKKRFFDRRIVFLFVISAFIFSSTSGYSQEDVAKYPRRPITYIQPFSAGVPVDLAIRLISKEAEKFLGQPVVVLNKPGAVGTIGVAAIASSRPDGYTIGNTPHSPMFIVPYLEKLPYHPIKDLTMIMQFGGFNFGVIVKEDSPFKNFKDLIHFAQQNPKKLTYGTAGATSLQFIFMEKIAKMNGVQMTHIPFKSSADAQTGLLGGHIHFMVGDFSPSLIESRDLRLLMLFREERADEYPNTPILKDMGYDFPFPSFICVAGPKGLPEGIVKKLENAFTKAIKEPLFIKGMKEDLRLPIIYRNSKDLTAYVANNYAACERMLKDMGLIK